MVGVWDSIGSEFSTVTEADDLVLLRVTFELSSLGGMFLKPASLRFPIPTELNEKRR
jgi:hypothetical protein